MDANKKSYDGYLTIKEFSELVGTTKEALRYYDRKGVFPHDRLGEKSEYKNEYRYYTPTQVTIFKMVSVLSEIGVTLREIGELRIGRTPEKLVKLLSRQKRIVADEICFLQEVVSVISTFQELLNEGLGVTETEIYVSEMLTKPIILGDINDFEGSVSFFRAFTCFLHATHEPKLNLSYPIGGCFESMNVFLKEPSQPTRFFSLDPKGYEEKSGGLYLIGYTRGYYGQTNDLPKRMASYAKKNGLVFTGPVYNTYLFDEMSVVDPEQYLLQVCASVKETRRTPSRRTHHRKNKKQTAK